MKSFGQTMLGLTIGPLIGFFITLPLMAYMWGITITVQGASVLGFLYLYPLTILIAIVAVFLIIGGIAALIHVVLR